MQRSVTFAVGEYYHLYNRGVDKREIFVDDHDYKRFIALLYISNSSAPIHFQNFFSDGHKIEEVFKIEQEEPLVAVGAYCLMPNHFHILVKEIQSGGISQFMKKLSTAYAMYFNARNVRTGALFQGRFKSVHIDDDVQFRYLYSYIHLNPAKIIDPDWREHLSHKSELASYIKQYPFSSYLDYVSATRPQRAILNVNEFPDYFDSLDEVQNMIDCWLEQHS